MFLVVLQQTTPDVVPLAELWQLGPVWAIIVYIIIRDVLPFMKDKLYPEVVAARKAQKNKEESVIDRQIQVQEKFIETLHSLNLSQAALAIQIEHLADSFGEAERARAAENTALAQALQQAEYARSVDNDRLALALEIVKEDLAALYGKLDQPRPSRQRGAG